MTHSETENRRAEAVQVILDAATEVFAEVGFEGARMDVIARRAGINKAMIYYRIGDKATLYAEVLHRAFSGTADRLLQLLEGARSPEEKIRVYIRAFVQTIEENPHLPPMMLREVASGGKNMPDLALADLGRILLILRDLLTEGVKTGAFVDIHPVLFHLLIVGPISMRTRLKSIAARRGDFQKILRRIDDDHPDMMGELTEMVIKGLKV